MEDVHGHARLKPVSSLPNLATLALTLTPTLTLAPAPILTRYTATLADGGTASLMSDAATAFAAGLVPAARTHSTRYSSLHTPHSSLLPRCPLLTPHRHVPLRYHSRTTPVPLLAQVLADGTACQPATLELLSASTVRVTLHEGFFHQVKLTLALTLAPALTPTLP